MGWAEVTLSWDVARAPVSDEMVLFDISLVPVSAPRLTPWEAAGNPTDPVLKEMLLAFSMAVAPRTTVPPEMPASPASMSPLGAKS